jgi:hypothetical protein
VTGRDRGRLGEAWGESWEKRFFLYVWKTVPTVINFLSEKFMMLQGKNANVWGRAGSRAKQGQHGTGMSAGVCSRVQGVLHSC